jgi:hypothetical protein
MRRRRLGRANNPFPARPVPAVSGVGTGIGPRPIALDPTFDGSQFLVNPREARWFIDRSQPDTQAAAGLHGRLIERGMANLRRSASNRKLQADTFYTLFCNFRYFVIFPFAFLPFIVYPHSWKRRADDQRQRVNESQRSRILLLR